MKFWFTSEIDFQASTSESQLAQRTNPIIIVGLLKMVL